MSDPISDLYNKGKKAATIATGDGSIDEALVAVAPDSVVRDARNAANAQRQFTAQGPQPTEVPPLTEIPGETGGGQSVSEGGALENLMKTGMFPRLMGPGGSGSVVMPEGQNFLPFGGKDKWQTVEQRPAEIEGAIQAGAKAEEDLGNAKADFYKRQQAKQQEELAILKQRQMERAQEFELRQKQIDDATRAYTNDLADTGKYWRNPGHIISAIGAAILAAGSPGDPGIGVRIITNAVNQDYKQRQELAQMHLGELRSGLADYRKIAGDAELGDKLAYAESNRVAAMELERIGGQFQGPIARAKAAAISKELMRNYEVQMAQLHAQMIYNRAQKQDPGILAVMKATGEGTNGVGWTPYDQKTGKPLVTAAPPNSTGPTGIPNGLGGKVMPGLSDETKQALEKRAPGVLAEYESSRNELIRRAAAASRGNPDKFNSEMERLEGDLEKDIKNVAVAAQPFVENMNGLRRLKQDMKVLELTSQRLGITPDALIGSKSDSIFSDSFMDKYHGIMRVWAAKDPANANAYQREEQAVADAVARFRQEKAGVGNAYIHANAGGNVTAGESVRMQQYLGFGWRGIQNFVDDQSQRTQAGYEGALNTAGTPAARAIYRVRQGLGSNYLDAPGISKPGPTSSMQEAVDKKSLLQKKAIQTLKNQSSASKNSEEIFTP